GRSRGAGSRVRPRLARRLDRRVRRALRAGGRRGSLRPAERTCRAGCDRRSAARRRGRVAPPSRLARLTARNRIVDERLDEVDRERDRVAELALVDERERVLGQVVFLVREVEDADRRDAGLREREMVGARLLAELGDHLVALRQPQPPRGRLRPVEERGGRAEELELLAVADAVEVDHADDRPDCAAVARVGDEPPGADQPDLLGTEGDELDGARRLRAGKVRGDLPKALDTGCVVDRARPAPDGVVVCADDDALVVTGAADAGDHVAVALPADERSANDEPRVLPGADPLAVG